MSAGRSGVGHVLSSDGHFGHPGLRSLRVRCVSPSLASLAPTACSRTRATPSPPLPSGHAAGAARAACHARGVPRRTSVNWRRPFRSGPRTRSPGGATGGRRAALVAGGMDAPATLKPAAMDAPATRKPAETYFSGSISPPAIVAAACQAAGSTLSETNRTEPSAMPTVTPPGCRLRGDRQP